MDAEDFSEIEKMWHSTPPAPKVDWVNPELGATLKKLWNASNWENDRWAQKIIVRRGIVPKGQFYRLHPPITSEVVLAFADYADALDFLVRPERWPLSPV